MNELTIGAIVFAAVFGAAIVGGLAQGFLPHSHRSAETKDAVKLAMALVATMTALVLSLLIADAQSNFATERTEITQMAAKISFLDRTLENFGPDASEERALIRHIVERMITKLWPGPGGRQASDEPTGFRGLELYNAIEHLAPHNEQQQLLKATALSSALDLGQTRWLLFEQSRISSISPALLIIVVSWLIILFLSFALFSPRNATVLISLMIAALSVSGGILLILELDRPFGGFVQISDAPMREVYTQLGH